MGPPLKAVLDANPDLRQGGMPAPQLGASITRMETVRAQQPGGELMGYVPHEDVTWFEQLYRVLPPNGMYNATPNKPVTVVLGAFRVPQSMVLVIIDYSFDIYRFSGASPSDFVPLETNRLSTQVGWDIKVDDKRPSNLRFQLVPAVQSQAQQAFPVTTPGVTPQSFQFDLVRASSLQGPAGAALAMMPQRRHRNGLVRIANTYIAKSGSMLVTSCSIFNKVPIPIGFFEADVCGMLLPQNVYDRWQAASVPIGDPLLNPIPGAP